MATVFDYSRARSKKRPLPLEEDTLKDDCAYWKKVANKLMSIPHHLSPQSNTRWVTKLHLHIRDRGASLPFPLDEALAEELKPISMFITMGEMACIFPPTGKPNGMTEIYTITGSASSKDHKTFFDALVFEPAPVEPNPLCEE